MRVRNDSLDVYPNHPAPVVIEQDGQRIVRQDVLWAFTPFKPGAGYATQLPELEEPPVAPVARPRASLRRSGECLLGARQEHA
jgi:hypothetical protein